MRYSLSLAMIAILSVVVACGGSGGSESVKGVPGITANFMPDEPNPGALSVATTQTSSNADTVSVGFTVTGTDDVFGAAFDVAYDPTKVQFVTSSYATTGPFVVGQAELQVAAIQPGTLVIGVTRVGGNPVNITGTATLVNLTFRASSAGSSVVGIPLGQAPELSDGQNPIPNIDWSGGTIVAN